MADKYKTITKNVQAIQFNFDELKSIYLFLDYRDVTYSIKNRTLSGIVTGRDGEKLSVAKNDYIVKDSEKKITIWKPEDFNKEFVKDTE